jgi:hypothetical protein
VQPASVEVITVAPQAPSKPSAVKGVSPRRAQILTRCEANTFVNYNEFHEDLSLNYWAVLASTSDMKVCICGTIASNSDLAPAKRIP